MKGQVILMSEVKLIGGAVAAAGIIALKNGWQRYDQKILKANNMKEIPLGTWLKELAILGAHGFVAGTTLGLGTILFIADTVKVDTTE
jgi:hypothetical protein